MAGQHVEVMRMLILGLLLVLLSAAAVILLLAYNNSGGPEQAIALFGWHITGVTPIEAFLAGIGLALIFSLGLWMVVSTGRRRRLARSKYLAEHRRADAVAAERDELAEQLAREREATASAHDRATTTPDTSTPDRDIATKQPQADHPAPTNRAR
jgi:ABC-type nickel/cobalt efflux system permease component RcnA